MMPAWEKNSLICGLCSADKLTYVRDAIAYRSDAAHANSEEVPYGS